MPFKKNLPSQSDFELASIGSLSRPKVVNAYSNWTDVSNTEQMFLEMICDKNADVLDIGCGTGRHANWLDGRFQTYLGIDASSPMIEAAKAHFPKLTFQKDDILNVNIAESSCDIILLMGNVLDFLHPLERRSRLFEKCYGWLRSGGVILGSSHLTEANQERGYYTEDYHGAEIHQYRLSAPEMVGEVEGFGFELSHFARDYRKEPAYWAYWVARKTN